MTASRLRVPSWDKFTFLWAIVAVVFLAGTGSAQGTQPVQVSDVPETFQNCCSKEGNPQGCQNLTAEQKQDCEASLKLPTTSVNRVFVDVLDPATASTQAPLHQPEQTQSIMQRRFGTSDYYNGRLFNGRIEHGGANFDDVTKGIYGINLNYNAAQDNLIVNTEGQVGGLLQSSLHMYGLGDGVGTTQVLECHGYSRGGDEGCEPWRIFAGIHGNFWGITIASRKDDPYTGETAFQSTRSGTRPVALDGHDLKAANDFGPVINLSKTYSIGNIGAITTCDGLIGELQKHATCLIGHGTRWDERFGVSTLTKLTADVSNDGPGGLGAPEYKNNVSYNQGAFVTAGSHTYFLSTQTSRGIAPDKDPQWVRTDRFSAGPVLVAIAVESSTGCKAESLASISSDDSRTELPKIVAVAAGSITVALARPHHSGELVACGGGIGHAIGFTNDIVAPGKWQGSLQSTNDAPYRLVYPVLATLPGNVIVTNSPPGNLGEGIYTLGFAGDTPKSIPTVAAALSGSRVTQLRTTSKGDLETIHRDRGGITRLPVPGIEIAGCTTPATAHMVQDGSGAYAVLDSGGAGCSAVSIKVQATYPNSYLIYPMAWARSNFDPAYIPARTNDLRFQPDQNQVITPSTSGYMLVDGAGKCEPADGFCTGDPIEQTYTNRQKTGSYFNLTRQVLNPGYGGDTLIFNFGGLTAADREVAIRDSYPQSAYYGSAATRWGIGSDGSGAFKAPQGLSIEGAHSVDITIHSLPRGGDNAVVTVGCVDPDAPCKSGQWNSYNLFSLDGPSGHAYLSFDPVTGMVSYSTPGYTKAGIQSRIVQSTILTSAIDESPIGRNSPAPGFFTMLQSNGSPVCTKAEPCPQPKAFTGTKTFGACTVTIQDGLIVNVTGC